MKKLVSFLKKLTHPLTSRVQKFTDYLANTDNPIIQYFYFMIAQVAYVIYFKCIYLDRFTDVGLVNFLIGNTLTWVGFYYYYRSWKGDAGTIN